MATLTTFTRFPALPLELRLEIFEMSVPGPQLITISTKKTMSTCTASYNIPAILHINRESRNLAKRIYKLEFGDRFARGVGVWMDISKDILYFETELSCYRFFGSGRIHSHEVAGYSVKKPIYDKIPALAFSKDSLTKKLAIPRLLSHMGRPQKIYIVLEKQGKKLFDYMHVGSMVFKMHLGTGWNKSNWFKFFDYQTPKVVEILMKDLKTLLATANPPFIKSKRLSPKLTKTFLKTSSCQYIL